jgi:hypothetical protein
MCTRCTLRQAVQNSARGAGSHANRDRNRQRRLLTNMGWTMDCLGHAGKLVRGIGWREQGLTRNSATKTLTACTQMRIRQRKNWQPAHRCEFSNEDIDSLHADANSTAQELTACTQMRIQQCATACASCWFDLARSETWTKDYPRHVSDSTDDAARAGR